MEGGVTAGWPTAILKDFSVNSPNTGYNMEHKIFIDFSLILKIGESLALKMFFFMSFFF